MMKVRKKIIREKAVIAIYQYLLIGASEKEIRTYLDNDTIFSKDENEYTYCLELISKTILHSIEYQQIIDKVLKVGWTVDRLSKMELAILLVATNELLEEQIDKKVVINEAVELSKKYCDEESYKYINGVLNQIK